MRYFAGLDWGGTEHALCIVDEAGQRVAEAKVAHSAAGLAQMLKRLRAVCPPGDLPIAIERPTGLLVDTLVEAGHPVVPIHPNAVNACRPRYRAAGAKNDPGDAYLLADVLRTDGHRFRTLKPLSDAIRGLRALVRGREDLVRERIAMANQLRSTLESFWPGAAQLFSAIDSQISLAFLERYPTPAAAARLGERRLEAFLRRSGYTGRRTAKELLQRLNAAPVAISGELEAEAKGQLVLTFVKVLKVLVAQIREVSSRIERSVADLVDGRVMMSFPRAGRISAAQIVAEIGDVRRFVSADHLAAESGVVPITRESGRQRGVGCRWACNKRLRRALTIFADNSRHDSPWAADVYRRARARGCQHAHAIRILARSWVYVLWRALLTHTEYDPQRHGQARRMATA